MTSRGAEPSVRWSGRAARFVVDAAAAGTRLDSFVGRRAGVSVTFARALIARGGVRVDDRPVTKGLHLRAGALVDVAPFGDPAAPVRPDDGVELVVIHEDADLIAIDKPAGMPSHPLDADETGTAANGIVARFPECARASPDPREGGLAHRLDTATSGVLIAARSRPAWTGLRRALGAEDCEKRYLCEVWGVPAAAEGRVASDIGRRGRRAGVVRTDGGGRRPLPAETRWAVLGRGAATALVEARLHTGRAHQVRAHLAAAGFPIVGDDRYGGASDSSPGAGPIVGLLLGLRLHAASVRLRHPMTGALLLIESVPPVWASRFASAL